MRLLQNKFGVRFAAAQQSRLTGTFRGNNSSADAELQRALAIMRNRARVLERDDDWTRKYLMTLTDNVLGSKGVKLDIKVMEMKRDKDGRPYKGVDEQASEAIERAWLDWCKSQNCDLSRKFTFLELGDLAFRATGRDGENLTQCVYGSRAKNKYGFAIRLFESDQLDEKYTTTLSNGNVVRMGVELDPDGVAVAYHFLKSHPGDMQLGQGYYERVRVEASSLIHTFRSERVGQTRGYTFLTSAMLTLHQLNDYEKAEIAAARAGAKKMGFFTKQYPDSYQGNGDEDSGIELDNVEDASFQELPLGVDIKAFDLGKPNPNQNAFIKVYLRKLAAGLGVSYTSLSGDLEGVNFSSIRAGLLDEREHYKTLQRWWIEQFLKPIFERWLEAALLSGAITLENGKPLPIEKMDKFNAPVWTPRRWTWVDPKNDIEAAILAINNNLTSPRRVIAESGQGDEAELWDECEADNAEMEARGLTKQTVSGQVVSPAGEEKPTEEKPKPAKPAEDTDEEEADKAA